MLGLAFAGGGAGADVIYETGFERGAVGTEWSHTARSELGGEFTSFLGRFESGAVRLTLGENGTGPGGPVSGGTTGDGSAQPTGVSRGGGVGGGPRGGGGLADLANPLTTFDVRPKAGGGDGGGNGGGNSFTPGVYNLTFDLYLFDSWDGLDRQFGEDRFEVVANGTTIFDEALETFEPWENALGGWTRPEENVFAGWARDLIYREISLDFSLDEAGTIVIDFIGKQNQALIDESWGIDNVRILAGEGRGAAVPAAPGVAVILGGLAGLSRRRR